MFKEIMIKESPPRDLTTFNETFSKGLRLRQFFGYFFLLAAIMLFLISVLTLKMVAPAIMFLFVAVMGYYMINKVKKTINLRKEVFKKGSVVIARVESQGRKFNPLKSNKDYIIAVRVNTEEQSNLYTIKSSSNYLWESSPVGSEIVGFYYNNNYFFGEEVACQFIFN